MIWSLVSGMAMPATDVNNGKGTELSLRFSMFGEEVDILKSSKEENK